MAASSWHGLAKADAWLGVRGPGMARLQLARRAVCADSPGTAVGSILALGTNGRARSPHVRDKSVRRPTRYCMGRQGGEFPQGEGAAGIHSTRAGIAGRTAGDV